jgi:hypothetical protein
LLYVLYYIIIVRVEQLCLDKYICCPLNALYIIYLFLT